MKYYLPVLFFSFCLFNCGRDNSKTDDIPLKVDRDWGQQKATCDWCKSDLPENAFCYYDEVIVEKQSVYELDSIYLDRSPLKYYCLSGNNAKNWFDKHPSRHRKYSRSTLLLNTSIFLNMGPSLPPPNSKPLGSSNTPSVKSKPATFELILQPFPTFRFCSVKCVKSFNESVKFSKPINSSLSL